MQSAGQSDSKWLQSYVFLEWSLNTLHQIFLLKAVYIYLINDIGDIPSLLVYQRHVLAMLPQ